jgi:hypothetical protein
MLWSTQGGEAQHENFIGHLIERQASLPRIFEAITDMVQCQLVGCGCVIYLFDANDELRVAFATASGACSDADAGHWEPIIGYEEHVSGSLLVTGFRPGRRLWEVSERAALLIAQALQADTARKLAL